MRARVPAHAWEQFDRLLGEGMSFRGAAEVVGASLDQARYRWKKIGGVRMRLGRNGGLSMLPEPEPIVPVDPMEAIWEQFDQALNEGASFRGAAAAAGVSHDRARYRWKKIGGMKMQLGRYGGLPKPLKPKEPKPVELPAEPLEKVQGPVTFYERCVLQVGLRAGRQQKQIATELQRNPSVICREVKRNSRPDGIYDARYAEAQASQRRRRPKGFKLADNPELVSRVEQCLRKGWSPQLIARVLKKDYPDDGSMQVSHETIYQALYVQSRGHLRRELRECLSLRRKARVPRGRATKAGQPYRNALTISQRPPSVEDRAVPGHWEGDLIVGGDGASAIGTLVERSTRFVILLHLPGGRHTADIVAASMIAAMSELPAHLRRSVTWDRGTELADYNEIMLNLQTPVYFADPRSPWQRGTNENTNRLLRFWFPKGSDLSSHTPEDLQRVQDTLNARPRPTLELRTPAQALTELLLPNAA